MLCRGKIMSLAQLYCQTWTVLQETREATPLCNELHQTIITDLQTRNTDAEVVHLLEVFSFIDPSKYVTDEEYVKKKGL